jgi:hypothetical protein
VANLAIDYFDLTRICELARRLHQLHRLGDDDAIDREFSAVCRTIWGFTLDDFTDDDLSPGDHAWLDQLTQECALEFAADRSYDLKDYIHGGFVADWWGFTWMILAEARGVLTPQKRAAAWCRHAEETWRRRRRSSQPPMARPSSPPGLRGYTCQASARI